MVNIIKIRTTGRKITPFIGSAQSSGEQQKWFAANIGEPVGNCVKRKVRKGMGIGEIHKAVRDCAKQYGRKSKGGASA